VTAWHAQGRLAARVLVSRLGREAQEITQALRVAEIEREAAGNT